MHCVTFKHLGPIRCANYEWIYEPQQVSVRRPWKKSTTFITQGLALLSWQHLQHCNSRLQHTRHVHGAYYTATSTARQTGPVLIRSIQKMGDYHSRFNDEFEYYLKVYLFPPILNESKIKSWKTYTCNKSVWVQIVYWTRLKYRHDCISPLGHPSPVYRNRSRRGVSPWPDIASSPQLGTPIHLYHSVPQLYTSSVKFCWENIQKWVQKINL